ncbi:MAG TPA: amylo-alpha-1,6-glucosidase [Actinomycetota bacterium]|nr:amylo-alpha-1,6-glucosidase [Actinomycetota bacterium]
MADTGQADAAAKPDGARAGEQQDAPLPALVVDIRDVQVIKHGSSFLLCDERGDVPEGNTAALGLYHRDTRFLSLYEMSISDLRPLVLHSSVARNYAQDVELAYPFRHMGPDGHVVKENLALSRHRVLGDTLMERIHVQNFGRTDRELRLELRFGADFLDIFEVRGQVRERRGQPQPAHVSRHEVRLGYRGLDGAGRSTTIRFSPQPDELDAERAVFELATPAGGEAEIVVEVQPTVGEASSPRRPIREARERLEQEYTNWRKRCTRFRTSNSQLSAFLDRAVLDLRMLLSEDDEGRPFIDAGVPWYSALFGRDSLITAYQCLMVNTDLSWATLDKLARFQGREEDPEREEEPGKILHELRVGEMAGTREIPHTPYYGAIDSTPLWLMVLASAYAWTGDRASLERLWPNALACLEWIDRYGDRDGDGFVEYEKVAPLGLDNQGWKDSHDAVVFPDGTKAKGPIALVEVQGYVFNAKLRAADLARVMGDDALAERLEKEAGDLKDRFNRAFWMEKEGFYALALDGDKRQVPTITSNPGHALWSAIVDEDKAARVARKLLSPALSSGYGIRTLADRQRAYDPIGYHTGSVWPHDCALIAHGLKRYGFDHEAMRVIDQLSFAGAHFPLARFPELFCGFSRDQVPEPVQYPVACRPQAWATGTPLLMMRSYGGITADAPNRTLYVHRPSLPEWLDQFEVLGMRVGAARVDMTFTRTRGVTSVQVPRKEGDLEVLIRQ